MNKQIIKSLYKKEIFDILRDKKTLLMMIVVPLVLYPLIFVGSMALASSMMTQSTSKAYHIAIDDMENADHLEDYFTMFAEKYDYEFIFVKDITTSVSGEEAVTSSFEDALKDKIIDAYVSREDKDGKERYVVHYVSSVTDSLTASSMIEDMLKEYQETIRELKIKANDLDPEYILDSVVYEKEDSATTEESVGSIFGYVIPFLMISSILMGAMYPAIDTTAGEKERGTLETLLTLPVSNLELIISKFLATSTIAVMAALLNVLSMGLLGAYFFQSMQLGDTAVTFSMASYIPAILLTLLCAVVFGMFASAVCLLICIFAKSFKEAQNYSTPVMLVFMLSGMAGMIPGLELNGVIPFIPVINICLLIAKLFVFEFDINIILIVVLSNVLYSMIAVVIMARVFCSESILFGDGSEGIRIIEKRSDMKEKQIPGMGDVVLLFSILLIILMLAGSILIVKYGIVGLVIEQLLILGCTAFYCWYIKTDFKKVFSLNKPCISGFVAGTIMWVGVYVLMMILTVLLSALFPGSAASASEDLTSILGNQPIWIILIVAALLPAICEEVAFRGFLFGTLSNRYKIVPAIIWTGLIFGLYHMNLVKLIVVGILGGFLAFAVYRTKSIATSMWMHFINNSFALIAGFYGEELADKLPILFKEDLSTVEIILLILFGAACLIISVLWMNAIGRKATKAAERHKMIDDFELEKFIDKEDDTINKTKVVNKIEMNETEEIDVANDTEEKSDTDQ